ncbi:MAG: hypothetical protein KF819_27110 [Labilithrix sp.]|nr:hypothetical protein [Labilithrix sp.]
MRSTRALLALLAFFLGLATVPHRVCERDAGAYFDGEHAKVDALGASVAAWTEGATLGASTFTTGSKRFDGEWLFGTYMMAAMGFGQVALESDDPARRAESVARMERCLDAMLSPEARAFDREAWGADALEGDRGHVAYLGYAGLALGLHRALAPSSRFSATHDAIASALVARFSASKTGFVETYPGEIYPVDNAAGLAAISLHAKALGAPPPAALARGLHAIRAHGVQSASGLLAQATSADASPLDPGRGSGTALAAYFLAYADEATSASLYRALRGDLYRTVIGFGAVLEHPSASSRGDIDSGPVLFGFGVSATGFAIGASRIHGDREAFASLYATAHLFGAPFDDEPDEGRKTRTHATGGPLGDAILFAMITAPRAAALARLARSA